MPDHARNAWWGLMGHRARGDENVVVRGVVRDARGLLLAVRVDVRGWELPGGTVDRGEAPEDALVREIREETGLDVEIEAWTGEYTRAGFLPHRTLAYRCRPTGGELRPSAETPRVAFFADGRPPATLFPWYREMIEDADGPGPHPVRRERRHGPRDIWAAFRIDWRMRWSGDRAR